MDFNFDFEGMFDVAQQIGLTILKIPVNAIKAIPSWVKLVVIFLLFCLALFITFKMIKKKDDWMHRSF